MNPESKKSSILTGLLCLPMSMNMSFRTLAPKQMSYGGPCGSNVRVLVAAPYCSICTWYNNTASPQESPVTAARTVGWGTLTSALRRKRPPCQHFSFSSISFILEFWLALEWSPICGNLLQQQCKTKADIFAFMDSFPQLTKHCKGFVFRSYWHKGVININMA